MISVTRLMQQGTPGIMAILRGVTPEECLGVGQVLIEAGILLIEVPLNSPEPLTSISRLQTEFADVAAIGAGTVLSRASVNHVRDAGGQFIVTPNTDAEVIECVVRYGMECFPGFFTASEALTAVRAGATRLKLFPASSSPASHIKAIKEILPLGIEVWAVGGTNATNVHDWLERGASGIGVGGALYRAGDAVIDVSQRARALVRAWREAHP